MIALKKISVSEEIMKRKYNFIGDTKKELDS